MVLNGKPIGHISWDQRYRPEYVEIGHNCIISKYKGHGYGKMQLKEALRRIREYEGISAFSTDNFPLCISIILVHVLSPIPVLLTDFKFLFILFLYYNN